MTRPISAPMLRVLRAFAAGEVDLCWGGWFTPADGRLVDRTGRALVNRGLVNPHTAKPTAAGRAVLEANP